MRGAKVGLLTPIIKVMFQNDVPVKEIAARLGISLSAVYQRIRYHGWPRPGAKTSAGQIREHIYAGKSRKEIRALGFNITTVQWLWGEIVHGRKRRFVSRRHRSNKAGEATSPKDGGDTPQLSVGCLPRRDSCAVRNIGADHSQDVSQVQDTPSPPTKKRRNRCTRTARALSV